MDIIGWAWRTFYRRYTGRPDKSPLANFARNQYGNAPARGLEGKSGGEGAIITWPIRNFVEGKLTLILIGDQFEREFLAQEFIWVNRVNPRERKYIYICKFFSHFSNLSTFFQVNIGKPGNKTFVKLVCKSTQQLVTCRFADLIN